MPAPIDDAKRLKYKHAVTQKLKKACEGSIGYKELYRKIHGIEPTKLELIRFKNRFYPNRSNPNSEFIGFCIEHLPSLQNVTLSEFFDIDENISGE